MGAWSWEWRAAVVVGLALAVGRGVGAEPPAERTPEQRKELEGKVRALSERALALYRDGKYAEATELLRQALEMYRKLYPKERYPQGHPELATSINNLAFLHRAQGEYARAEPLFREALAMRRGLYPRERFPHGHSDLANSINNLAVLHQSQGEYAKAEPLCREALEMSRKVYPKERYPQGHPELATSINNLAWLHQAQGDYAKAEPLHREALAMLRGLYPRERFPQGHPHLALSINNLAFLHDSQGEYAKAEPLYREALEMCRKVYSRERFSQGHPDLARSINNLALLHRAQGEYAKAEPLCREALEMYRKVYPRERYPHGHPELAQSIDNLAGLHHSQGEYARAEPLLREALQMYQSQLWTLADTAAEATALNHAAALPLTRDGFLSVTRRRPAAADVYEPLWRDKAGLARVLERRHLDLLASQDPRARDLARDLLAARQALARALLSLDPKERPRLNKLTEDKEDLERELARQLRLATPGRADSTTPAALSKALPRQTAFIDLLRYTDFDHDPKVPGKKGERRTRRYVAFVLGAGQPAVRVELGEAGPIEEAWAAWRQAVTAGRDDRKAAARFGQLVWEPLRRHLPAGVQAVYLAPDGRLIYVPWGALPGREPGTVLLEDHAVAVVPHGPWLLRQLQAAPAKPDRAGPLLAVGGVDYARPPAAVEEAPRDGPALRAAPTAGKRVAWGELPGTTREQQQVLGLARTALKAEPLARSGRAASTGQLLEDLPRARYAHLATHGFFAGPQFRSAFQVDEKAFERLRWERGTVGARSPLVLSGLVLAGANRQGKDAAADRGILTAEAIVSLRLADLELAVLSACDSGLGEGGDVGGGEGVYGLQRAFHLAGCKNVVASLWKVDDDATCALMALFYRNLWVEKMSPLEALRQAQLHVYRNPQAIAELAQKRGIDFTERELPRVTAKPAEKGQRAHPSLWAAFVLSGTGR